VKRALVIAAALACAQVATAQADDKKARADALFERAGADFTAGRYQEAIKGFREAYDLVRDPVYLFNLAQAYRKVLDCVAAAEHYRRFLDEAKDAAPETRTSVERWIAELSPCEEQRKKEMEAARRYEEAEKQRRADEAARAAAQKQAALGDRGRGTRRLGMMVGAGGGVLLGAGGLFALRAQRISKELRKECPQGNCEWTTEREDREDAAERSDVFAIVGFATGTAAAITGAILYLRGRSMGNERVTVTPTTNGAAVSIRF
jgi:tetratricopeptide (TPR) repeat protein